MEKIRSSLTLLQTQLKKRPKLAYFVFYTLIFFITFRIAFSAFYKLDKSFIWNADGLFMHYNFLGYFGQYLRTFARSILNGFPEIEFWSKDFGYGSDIFAVLNARLGDPLNYLAILFRRKDTETLHNILAFLRIYLAGISFSYFCYKHKKKMFPTLIGSLCYCFCGLVFWAGVRHLYFMNQLIYLPLLLLGVEKILKNKKGTLFSFMIFISAIGNFYFFYMLTIIAVIYAATIFLSQKENRQLKKFIFTVLKFAKFYLIGIGLAAFLLLPTILAYFNNGRTGVEYDNNLLFRNLAYYIEFIPRWISQGTEYGEATGYLPIALICAITLFFIKKEKYNKLRFLLLLGTLFLLIPFFGWAFNGFSYITNRWIFSYCLVVSYIVTVCIPYILTIPPNSKIQKFLFLFMFVYFIFVLHNKRLYSKTFLASAVLLAITIITIAYIFPYLRKQLSPEEYKKISYSTMLVLVIISAFANGDARFATNKENYVSEYLDENTAETILTTSPASSVINLAGNDSNFYRIDETQYIMNTQAAQHYNGVAFYTSLLDGHITNFHQLLNVSNATYGQTFNFKGLDRRAFIEVLLSVQYYASLSDDIEIPYGFTDISTDATLFAGHRVYKNENYLPLGFTYDSYITEDEFQTLTPVQRQQAMLQSIIVPNEIETVKRGTPVYEDVECSYTVVNTEEIYMENNTIHVLNTSAELRIDFQGTDFSETYLCINGLTMKDIKTEEDDIYWQPSTTARITLYSPNFKNSYTYRDPAHKAYTGIHDYIMNMGYTEEGRTYCTLRFNVAGEYQFDNLKIICQPMQNLSTYTNQLSQEVLQNLTYEANEIRGKITLSQNKILFLSIPFNNGWTLYVDGEKKELINGNIMGIAIPLTAGEHSIILQYQTPGFVMGIIISASTLFLVLIYITFVNYSKYKGKIAWKK